MKVGQIIKNNQPAEFKKLNNYRRKKKRKKRKREENLSTDDFAKMMQHSSYKRVGGAIRQVR